MTVPAAPTQPFAITEDKIRMWLRDYALGHLPGGQGNIILDSIQFTPEEIDLAMEMAVGAFNAITPISGFTRETFPNPYVYMLGIVKFLLMSESFHQIRNQATVQDGDIAPTGIYDKTQAYVMLSETVGKEWYELSRGMKAQFNMESAYDVLHSGYRNVSRHRYGP